MANKPPNIRLTGIRGSIPPGYILGRVSAGIGGVELISQGKAKASGLIPVTLPPSGPAGGDLSGTYPDPTVAKLQGRAVDSTAPSTDEVLAWLGSSWGPLALASVAYSGSYLDLSNLPPLTGGTTGQVLTKISGTDYDFHWATPSGGSGGGASSFWLDGTHGYIAEVDSSGQMVLDGSGNAIYDTDPVLPSAMLPIISSTVFGAGKVDNLSILAAAGVLGTKFLGFLYTKAAATTVTDSAFTKMVMDSSVVDTTGGAYNTSTGKFTATKAGYYLCFASCIGQCNGGGTMGQTALWINQNGTVGSGGTIIAVSSAPQATSFSTDKSATAIVVGIAFLNGTTDWIEMDTYVAGSGGTTRQINNPGASFFGAVYVGGS